MSLNMSTYPSSERVLGGVVHVPMETSRRHDVKPGRLGDRREAGKITPEADRRPVDEGVRAGIA